MTNPNLFSQFSGDEQDQIRTLVENFYQARKAQPDPPEGLMAAFGVFADQVKEIIDQAAARDPSGILALQAKLIGGTLGLLGFFLDYEKIRDKGLPPEAGYQYAAARLEQSILTNWNAFNRRWRDCWHHLWWPTWYIGGWLVRSRLRHRGRDTE